VVAVEQARKYGEGVATAYAHTAHELGRHLSQVAINLQAYPEDVQRRVEYCRFLVLGMSDDDAQLRLYRSMRKRLRFLREWIDEIVQVVRFAAEADALRDSREGYVRAIRVDTKQVGSSIELPDLRDNASERDVAMARGAVRAVLALGAYLLNAFDAASYVLDDSAHGGPRLPSASEIGLSATQAGDWMEITCTNLALTDDAADAENHVRDAVLRADRYPDEVHSYDYVVWVLRRAGSPPPTAQWQDEGDGRARFTLSYRVRLSASQA
jgi:hypothetical protein